MVLHKEHVKYNKYNRIDRKQLHRTTQSSSIRMRSVCALRHRAASASPKRDGMRRRCGQHERARPHSRTRSRRPKPTSRCRSSSRAFCRRRSSSAIISCSICALAASTRRVTSISISSLRRSSSSSTRFLTSSSMRLAVSSSTIWAARFSERGFISKRLTQVGSEIVRLTFCSVSFWRRCRSISASRSTSSILRLRVRLLRCLDEVCMDASLLLSDEMESERFLHPVRKWEESVSTEQHNKPGAHITTLG